MEMSEDSGDLVIGTMDLLVGSAVGCSRNVVNVGHSLARSFRAFLIRFFGSVPGVRNEVSDTAVAFPLRSAVLCPKCTFQCSLTPLNCLSICLLVFH